MVKFAIRNKGTCGASKPRKGKRILCSLLFAFFVAAAFFRHENAQQLYALSSIRMDSWVGDQQTQTSATDTSHTTPTSFHKSMISPPIPRSSAIRCPQKSWDQVRRDKKSQMREDAILFENHFNGFCNGTYIEMGAVDGLTFSNSYLWHKQFDFAGLLIELIPQKFQQCQQNRRHELAVVNAAVCNQKQDVHVVEVKKWGGVVNGVWEFASDDYRRKVWPKIRNPSNLKTVPCWPMADILDHHLAHEPRVARQQVAVDTSEDTADSQPTTHYFFDFFSLDVEGAEYSVLQSIDWSRTAFGVLFVESVYKNQSEERTDTITTFLAKKGYTFLGEKNGSLWYQHKDYQRIYDAVTHSQ